MILGDSGGGLAGTFRSIPHSAAGGGGGAVVFAEVWLVCMPTQTRSTEKLELLASTLESIGQEETERNLGCPKGLRILWLESLLWYIMISLKLFLILSLCRMPQFLFWKSVTPYYILVNILQKHFILRITFFLETLEFLKLLFTDLSFGAGSCHVVALGGLEFVG